MLVSRHASSYIPFKRIAIQLVFLYGRYRACVENTSETNEKNGHQMISWHSKIAVYTK